MYYMQLHPLCKVTVAQSYIIEKIISHVKRSPSVTFTYLAHMYKHGCIYVHMLHEWKAVNE